MKLDVIIDSKTHRIEVPQDMLDDGEDFFQKMDRDMDAGWQMGPEFVESPTTAQRCQIAANKLLVSISAQNKLLVQLMAAYILRRMPAIQAVDIDTAGEMLNTQLIFDRRFQTPSTSSIHGLVEPRTGTGAPDVTLANRPTKGTGAFDVHANAESDVSQVYKVGKAYRFATYDRASGRWVESPFAATEEEAKKLREAACARLLEQRMPR